MNSSGEHVLPVVPEVVRVLPIDEANVRAYWAMKCRLADTSVEECICSYWSFEAVPIVGHGAICKALANILTASPELG